MKTKQFSLRARANSFRFAWEGICGFFGQEHNAWIHLASSFAVAVFALVLKVSSGEIIALVVVSSFVWVAEIFNTVIEKIMDFISPAYHPQVKRIKDLAAAGVLIASIAAVTVGSIIFIPKIFK